MASVSNAAMNMGVQFFLFKDKNVAGTKKKEHLSLIERVRNGII